MVAGVVGIDGEVAGYDLGVIAAQAAYLALVTVLLLGLLTRRAHRPQEVATWAAAHSLVLTTGNRALIRYYVQLAITTRCIGAVAGIYGGYVFDRAFGLDTSAGAGWWAWAVVGWVTGELWAQHQVATPVPTPAVASLTPRRLADYLPWGLRWAPVIGVAVIGVTGALTRAVVEPGPGAAPALPGWPSLAGRVAAGLVVAVVVAAVQQRVVGRRQVPLAADLVAADDAIRTSTIHQLAGAGAALTCFLALVDHRSVTGAAGSSSPAWLGAIPVVLIAAAAVSLHHFTLRAWRVRRSVGAGRRRPAAVPS